MIASFSRALAEGLKAFDVRADFNEELADAVDEIYEASTVKVDPLSVGLL